MKETNGKRGPAAAAPAATGKKDLAVRKDPADYRYEISTPSGGFAGERAGVKFRDGKGYTDDEDCVEACLSFGYTVLDRKAKKQFPAADYAKLDDEQIHALLKRHEKAIFALPDFHEPKTRAEAIALLVHVQAPIEPAKA